MEAAVSIDWLTFSTKRDVSGPQEVIRDYLGMDPDLFQDPGYGQLGYNKVLAFNNIRVCYDPRQDTYFKDMGVCVSMSGNGCRTFDAMSSLGGAGASAFPALLSSLHGDPDVNVSRVDIACDDRDNYLDMDKIVEYTEANNINSRMTRRSVITSYKDAERKAATVYVGAPSSDFRLRIYDKAAEQQVEGHWIRVEMVLRAKQANAFVALVANGEAIGSLAARILNDKFSYIERDDSNISRCTVCSWWQRFVGVLESVHLVARETIQHPVECIDAWLEFQVAPSLCIIFDTLGFARLWEMARNAKHRLNPKQRALIQDYNALRRVSAVSAR